MPKALSIVAILAVSAFAMACSKGPAEAAIKAADTAVEAVKAQAEPLVPDQFAALQAEAARAHELFNQGDYKAAGEVAKAIPAKSQEVLAAAMTHKDELTKTFTELQTSVPGMVEALTTHVAGLKGRAPGGMDKAAFESASTAVTGLGQRWSEIANSFQGGDVLSAVERAKAFKAEIESLMSQFGIAALAAAPAA